MSRYDRLIDDRSCKAILMLTPANRTLPVSIPATLQDCGQSGGQCLQPLNVIKFCK